MHLYRVSYS